MWPKILLYSVSLPPSFVCISWNSKLHSDISIILFLKLNKQILWTFFSGLLVLLDLLMENYITFLYLIFNIFNIFNYLMLSYVFIHSLLYLFFFYVNPFILVWLLLHLFFFLVVFLVLLYNLFSFSLTSLLSQVLLLRFLEFFGINFVPWNFCWLFRWFFLDSFLLKLLELFISTVTFHHID